MNKELIIEYNNPLQAKIVKKDKNKPWPNNDCSDIAKKFLGKTFEFIKKTNDEK